MEKKWRVMFSPGKLASKHCGDLDVAERVAPRLPGGHRLTATSGRVRAYFCASRNRNKTLVVTAGRKEAKRRGTCSNIATHAALALVSDSLTTTPTCCSQSCCNKKNFLQARADELCFNTKDKRTIAATTAATTIIATTTEASIPTPLNATKTTTITTKTKTTNPSTPTPSNTIVTTNSTPTPPIPLSSLSPSSSSTSTTTTTASSRANPSTTATTTTCSLPVSPASSAESAPSTVSMSENSRSSSRVFPLKRLSRRTLNLRLNRTTTTTTSAATAAARESSTHGMDRLTTTAAATTTFTTTTTTTTTSATNDAAVDGRSLVGLASPDPTTPASPTREVAPKTTMLLYSGDHGVDSRHNHHINCEEETERPCASSRTHHHRDDVEEEDKNNNDCTINSVTVDDSALSDNDDKKVNGLSSSSPNRQSGTFSSSSSSWLVSSLSPIENDSADDIPTNTTQQSDQALLVNRHQNSVSDTRNGHLMTSGQLQCDVDDADDRSVSSSALTIFSSWLSSFTSSSSSCESCQRDRSQLQSDSACPRAVCQHKQEQTLRRSHKTGAMSTSLLRSLLLYTCLALLAWPGQATLDIPAFEYQRKFHQPLNLGECPQREIKVQAGNNSTALEEQRCNLHHRGSVTHIPRELDDSQNVLITSPSRVLAYLGLCGGEAAAFLGILNKGDCLAVEIASRLTFTEKTMVRAFVGYYRKSVDVLDSVETANNMIRDMDRYYRDKVYLKHRSYGTQEVIFVQFRFKSAKMTAAAKNVKLDSRAMSDYMRAVEQRVGKPRRITVITLSTATQDTYELKRFSGKLWDRAVRHVQIKENEMRRTKNNINTNVIFPHLMYTLYPFVEEKNTSLRTSDPIPWEKTSILEIQLRQAISVAKKTSRKCRGNRKKPCRRMRELRRKLIAIHAEIHTVRSEWYNYSMTEKQAFVARYSARVKSYSSVTERVVSSVREMLKREKMKKFKRKKNKPNQIPMLTTGRMNRMHRIRHSRRRSKVRKG